MKPFLVLWLALATALPATAAEPLVPGSDRPPLVPGSDPAPIVRQTPDYGRNGPSFVPLHRRELQERLDDLDRENAQGDLDPFERRERLDTRQELHELNRSRD